MSYETIVEQVKTIPEEYLSDVSDYLGYVKYKIGMIKAKSAENVPDYKKEFVNLAGKIHLDADEARKFREESVV